MFRLDFIANGENFITSNGLQYRVIGERPIDIESIEVHLHQTDSDPRTLAKNLSSATVLKGTLRSASSFVNPTITIQSGTPFFWNYVYIPSMQRYYFVRDVRVIRKNLYEVSLQCDVLMTYKNAILNLETRVLRSESKHNWDYTDTLPPSYSYVRLGAYSSKVINGIGFNYPKADIPIDSSDQIISYGHLSFKVLCSKLNVGSGFETPSFGYVWCTATIKGFKQFLNSIYQSGYFAGDYKISDIISEIKWIPTTIPATTGEYRFVQEIVFENEQTMYNSASVGGIGRYDFRVGNNFLTTKTITEWRITHPIETKNYMNSPPFRQMALLFNPFGMVKLDSEVWGRRGTIYIRAEVDIVSGNANLYIYDGNYRELISSSNVAIPIDLTYIARSGRDVANAVISSVSGIVKAIPTGFLTVPHTKKTLNRMGGNAVGEILENVSDGITNSFILPTFSQVSGTGQADSNAMNTPILLVKQLDQPNPNLKTQGWLLNEDIRLSNLHGYCLVDSGVHIEGQIATSMATKPEIEEIESLLSSGVILP